MGKLERSKDAPNVDLAEITQQITSMQITSSDEFNSAKEIARAVKGEIANIQAQFKTEKDLACKTHKAICNEEKQTLAPWEHIIDVVESAMNSYINSGEQALVTIDNINTDGMSLRKDFEIEIIDKEAVPINFKGAELRPVSEKAIKELVKDFDGDIEIAGVKISKIKKITLKKG